MNCTDDFGFSPSGIQLHRPRIVGKIQSIRATSKGWNGVLLAEIPEIRQRVVMWQSMEKAERLELVLREIGERRLLERRKGFVFWHKDGDSFFGVVGLVLESLNDFGGLKIVEESVEWASHREQVS